jgi:chromate transport protein ChrA
MENLIDQLLNDPKMLAVAVILVVLILFAAFRKAMKILIVAVLLTVAFLVYVIQTGKDIPDDAGLGEKPLRSEHKAER